MEPIEIAFVGILVVAVLAVAGLVYYLRRRSQLDDAVELTPADYEHSEFRTGPKQVTINVVLGVCIALGSAFFFFVDPEPIAAGLCLLLGLGLIGYGFYIRNSRIVFRNWTIFSLRGEKVLWKMDIADIDEITRVSVNGNETHFVLKPNHGKSRNVSYGNYENPRKLKVMLLDPKRAFEDARG